MPTRCTRAVQPGLHGGVHATCCHDGRVDTAVDAWALEHACFACGAGGEHPGGGEKEEVGDVCRQREGSVEGVQRGACKGDEGKRRSRGVLGWEREARGMGMGRGGGMEGGPRGHARGRERSKRKGQALATRNCVWTAIRARPQPISPPVAAEVQPHATKEPCKCTWWGQAAHTREARGRRTRGRQGGGAHEGGKGAVHTREARGRYLATSVEAVLGEVVPSQAAAPTVPCNKCGGCSKRARR
eukprot:362044-Chlamydomonas_euryale.AAC.1